MIIKSVAAASIIAVSMFAAIGTLQAACVKQPAGWHMVSKKCHIKPAGNWKQYSSGVYLKPVAKRMF